MRRVVARHYERSAKVPVNVTVDKVLFDFIEYGVQNRIFQSRSHAVNWALQLLQQYLSHLPRTAEEIQKLGQQSPDTPERNFR